MPETLINQRPQSYTDFKTHRMTPYKKRRKETENAKNTDCNPVHEHDTGAVRRSARPDGQAGRHGRAVPPKLTRV